MFVRPLSTDEGRKLARIPLGRPRRQRATYHRYDEVMDMLAALDLATGTLFYRNL